MILLRKRNIAVHKLLIIDCIMEASEEIYGHYLIYPDTERILRRS